MSSWSPRRSPPGAIPAYEAALAAVQGEGALARLEAAAAPLMDGFMASAERLYRNFMGIART